MTTPHPHYQQGNQMVPQEPSMDADSDSGQEMGPGDSAYVDHRSQTRRAPVLNNTPKQRLRWWDGKPKRDQKAKDRVIESRHSHRLVLHRCSLTNTAVQPDQIEYAHLLPLATDEKIVRF